MDINKQIIDQRIRKIVEDYPEWFQEIGDEIKKIAKSFVIFSVSNYLGIDLDGSYELVTEGGSDAGIDAIYVEEVVEYEFLVTIFQCKYTFDLEKDSNFPVNAINRVINTISAIFDPKKKLEMNEKLKPKVEEIRSLIYEGYIPKVKCVLCNNGLTWNDEGIQIIHNAGFAEDQVRFEHYNHNNIVDGLRSIKEISDSIVLNGKAIVEEFNYKRVLIGKISIMEISKIMDRYGEFLLEKNIRRYLGLHKNRVNEAIRDTLTVTSEKGNFYFYNNGITMVCSQFSYNALAGEDWNVRMQNFQIINGGQTCKTIQHTVNENPNGDYTGAFVLLRLYELAEEDSDLIISKITLATNSQNPVNLMDLKANEQIQQKLELDIKELGYNYKRKRDFSTPSINSIPMSVAAEAVFTIWRKKPHITKFNKKELFNKFYNEIFHNLNGSQLIIAVLIHRYCDNQRKNYDLISKYPHISYSSYFSAMLIGSRLLKKCGISLDQLIHSNFQAIKNDFETGKTDYFKEAIDFIDKQLNEYFHVNYREIELRRLSATFRSGEFLHLFDSYL